MYKIVDKKVLNPTVTFMSVEAPLVAKKAEPGQFIILRVDEEGERIPLTIAEYDREKGSITIIFQEIVQTHEGKPRSASRPTVQVEKILLFLDFPKTSEGKSVYLYNY